jgi:hypothetical protein
MSKEEQPKNGNGNGSNGVFVKFVLSAALLLIVGGIGSGLIAWNNLSNAVVRLEEKKSDNSEQSRLHSDIEARTRIIESSIIRIDRSLISIDETLRRMHNYGPTTRNDDPTPFTFSQAKTAGTITSNSN